MDHLRADVPNHRIDLLWITHPHSDHLGGAFDVLRSFEVGAYVDNGRRSQEPSVRRVRVLADERRVARYVVDPDHRTLPFETESAATLTAIVPPTWPGSCAHDENDCSIGLRIDDCASSVLFTGDAERAEEAEIGPGRAATLLQVGHHGSATSSSPRFLAAVRPAYPVISAGKSEESLNRGYCHPRDAVVNRLTAALGGPGRRTIRAFAGERCDRATRDDWRDTPASDRLWATERDGDVVLTTSGDGRFSRE